MKPKTLLGLGLGLLLSACQTPPPIPPPSNTSWLENSCVPNSFLMDNSLRKAGFKSHCLTITTKRLDQFAYSHMIVIYMAPKGQNQMCAWDTLHGNLMLDGAFYGDGWTEASKWLDEGGRVSNEYLYCATVQPQPLSK